MSGAGAVSQYSILRKLASGGMGEVYLAQQTSIEGFSREVVIKRIHATYAADPDFVTMFLQEARIAALLDHSNIVQIYELGQQHGDYFIVMEYVCGLSLSRLLKAADGPLPLPLCIQIGAGVAAGLQYAHEKKNHRGEPLNLVHRDISPPNILLSTSGSVKITDFGIAKIKDSVTHTAAGVIKGKYAYLSPEQARGEPATAQADIYSLGLVLYEATTGQRAFSLANDIDLLRAVADGRVPPPETHVPDYPRDLSEVLMRALEPEPEKRYRECHQLQDDLLKLLVARRILTSPAKLGQYVEQYMEHPALDEAAFPAEGIPAELQEVAIEHVVSAISIEAELPPDDRSGFDDKTTCDDSLSTDEEPCAGQQDRAAEPGPSPEAAVVELQHASAVTDEADLFDDNAETVMVDRADQLPGSPLTSSPFSRPWTEKLEPRSSAAGLPVATEFSEEARSTSSRVLWIVLTAGLAFLGAAITSVLLVRTWPASESSSAASQDLGRAALAQPADAAPAVLPPAGARHHHQHRAVRSSRAHAPSRAP